tara:strand:- start:1709 stop:3232 length:1524 start_codon:yes stop_codon:yes gene_type:complete
LRERAQAHTIFLFYEERERETIFFVFFLLFSPFDIRISVHKQTCFFLLLSLFKQHRPRRKNTMRSFSSHKKKRIMFVTSRTTTMRHLMASYTRVVSSVANAERTAFASSSSPSTLAPRQQEEMLRSKTNSFRRSFLMTSSRSNNKEDEEVKCDAIRVRRRRRKTTTIPTRGFAAKSSGEDQEEQEQEEETTTDFAKLDGDSAGKYVLVSKSQLPLDQCKAIEREFAFTGANGLLYRKCDDALREVVARHEQVHLRGYRGSGKSVSLAMLVLRERALGSLVVYLPRASHLVTRSSYQKHGEGEQEDLWDTPDAARVFLHAVAAEPNETLLGKIKTSDGKQTLLEIVKSGLEKGDQHVTQNAIDVVDELVKQKDVRVVFAFDEHNALYGPSDMHEVKGPRSRKNIHTDRLRLALKLRSCFPTANGGRYIACDSTTDVGSSNPVFKSEDENVFDFEIPKFNVAETYALLKHYEEVGKCSRGINKQIALEFKALTNGKVKEIQEYLMFQNA